MTDAVKKIEDDEDEIVIVDEGEAPVKLEEEEERLRSTDDEPDEDDIGSVDGETPEAKSARRKDERRKRKERQRRAERDSKEQLEHSRYEIEKLTKRLASVETHALNGEAKRVDQEMFNAQRRYEYAENAYAEAVAKGDGIGSAKALRAKDEASAAYSNAQHLKARLSTIAQEQSQAPAPKPRPADPKVKAHATAFLERHPWLDPAGQKDIDSKITRAIDLDMTADGLNPADEDYWTELEARMKKRMPDRFKEATGRKSPPVSSGSDRAGSGKTTFVLSKARKDALIEAGYWDDPKQRMKMVKQYQAHDLANPKK